MAHIDPSKRRYIAACLTSAYRRGAPAAYAPSSVRCGESLRIFRGGDEGGVALALTCHRGRVQARSGISHRDAEPGAAPCTVHSARHTSLRKACTAYVQCIPDTFLDFDDGAGSRANEHGHEARGGAFCFRDQVRGIAIAALVCGGRGRNHML